MMNEADGVYPLHDRGMVEPIFTKENIDTMRPHIQSTVNDLLDAMLKTGGKAPVDLVEKFALPVPSYVGSSFLHIFAVTFAAY